MNRITRFAVVSVALTILAASSLHAQDAEAERSRVQPDGLTLVEGYTAEQVGAFHGMFDLTTWQVTQDNDYARYTLLRATEFFPHAVIQRSGPTAALESAPREEVGRFVLGGLDLERFLVVSPTDAFIVVHQGRVIYERYPRMRPADRHLYWSVSKTLAGLMIGQLVAEGQVRLSEPVERYIPALVGTAWQGTPVADILDQASGMDALENDEADTWQRPELAVFQFESSLGLLAWTPAAERSTYDVVASIGRLRPPGERFEYLSVNTFVLGWLVESVTGKPYATAVSERIWGAMGAEADAAIVIAPSTGATGSHGALSGTLRDLARFGMLFTPSRHVVSSTPVVPEAYLRRVQSEGRPDLVAAAGPGSAGLVTRWPDPAHHQAGQWDAVWADGDLYKGGFRGQGLYVSRSRDLVIAFFSSAYAAQKIWARELARSGLF